MSANVKPTTPANQAGPEPLSHEEFEARFRARVAQLEKESGGPLSDYSKFLLHQAMWSALASGATSDKE